MKKILFTIIGLIWMHMLIAQAPEIQWERNFGGDETENFTGLGESPDGYFYFAGTSTSPASGDRTQARRGSYDFWIVKTDADGNIIWNKAVGGGGATRMNSMTVTADGGIILAGNTDAGANYEKSEPNRGPIGSVDIWVIKLDNKGNKVWDKTLGGTDSDAPFAIAETPDGGCIVAGESSSPKSGDKSEENYGKRDAWAIKLNNLGVKEWDKVYGGSEGDVFYSVVNTNDGGFLFGGASVSGISGNKTEASRGGADCWLVKTDANGNIEWDKTYGGDKTDNVYSIKQLESGEYIIGAYSESEISGDKTMKSKGFGDLWLLKLNNSGSIIWQRGIGGSSSDFLAKIDKTKDGGIVIGMSTNSTISGDKTIPNFGGGNDYWIVKVDSEGSILWQDSYGDVSNDDLFDAMSTSDGGYLMGGFSNKWRKGDFWVIKLKPEISTGIFGQSTLVKMRLYPNPVKNLLNFEFGFNQSLLNNSIEIYDIMGKMILNKKINIIEGRTSFEINLPNGTYIVKAMVNNQLYYNRFIVFQ
jgi:hypothetical protein